MNFMYDPIQQNLASENKQNLPHFLKGYMICLILRLHLIKIIYDVQLGPGLQISVSSLFSKFSKNCD